MTWDNDPRRWVTGQCGTVPGGSLLCFRWPGSVPTSIAWRSPSWRQLPCRGWVKSEKLLRDAQPNCVISEESEKVAGVFFLAKTC